LLIATTISLRSVWVTDSLSWQGMDSTHESVVITQYGLQAARLGLRFFYDQKLVPPSRGRNRLKPPEELPDVGFHFSSIAQERASTLDTGLGWTSIEK